MLVPKFEMDSTVIVESSWSPRETGVLPRGPVWRSKGTESLTRKTTMFVPGKSLRRA